ncbi:hypothetical protein E2562_021963 [Oryza meyeriana var. granulata]|uniref:Uncharacterized protein n=1 Tax=Oryza meyeriana var. granulata TaxID=110450 RepID=A0A6G1DNN5_9ORYZ|nr:hypothetical protein E2562_021963 [Oryza meyeriana var. granulata]
MVTFDGDIDVVAVDQSITFRQTVEVPKMTDRRQCVHWTERFVISKPRERRVAWPIFGVDNSSCVETAPASNRGSPGDKTTKYDDVAGGDRAGIG